ncbi:hypothetical protein [Falsirhodobacter xinxiangensis]|uniref:hypothetical protein n=1 Tax=Falsirhodobacter xinxiangensis TaxID=2530049 RepID=UPI0010AA6F31|nr:hypothetical protein [Rhodobacter xinxiangensis]
MTPEQIASLALAYAAGLRSTAEAMRATPPQPSLTVLAHLLGAAAELEALAPRARNNYSEAIMEVFRILGKPRSLTLDFTKAQQEAKLKKRELGKDNYDIEF